jgi:hypothetical protein
MTRKHTSNDVDGTNVIHTQKKNKKTLTLVISNEIFTP